MRYTTVLSILLVTVLGCAVLNQPTFQIEPSQLSSMTNPQLVDGNLDTVSTFAVNGQIEKKYRTFDRKMRDGIQAERRYTTSVKGSYRTHAVIKLNEPTYISYVEVYPESRIPKLALTTTLEDPPRFDTSFDVVRDKQHTNVEGKRPVRIKINREILYLRLTADGIEDRQNSIRDKNDEDKLIQIPLKGAEIREVKFFSR
ncbi:hypothetical protein F4X73_02325 [Candidatus Poribacteria bacterium]|nr:hypothetical protein [Candidatus Poribacteria bacterium]